MIFTAFVLLAVTAVSSEDCYNDGNEFCIYSDDILSGDLLPGSFFFMDQYNTRNMSRSSDDTLADGSFFTAMDKMEYHRKRMNEYLCHGYVAEEIVKKIGTIRVKRRNDLMFNDPISSLSENFTTHDKLLSDEGSVKYKNWLERTTTLDDVYNHYSPHMEFHKKHEVYEDAETEGEIEEFEGEVTALTSPTPVGKIGKLGFKGEHVVSVPNYNLLRYGHPMHGPHLHPHQMTHPPLLPTIHEQHIYLPNPQENYHDYHHQVPIYHHKGKGHDLSIKDFFEIALTALAFLAFGLFIIQLLMNVTAPMMATTTPPPAINTRRNFALIEENRRYRRNVFGGPSLSYPEGNEELNELAYRVLRSIESILVAQADAGNCLRHFLCRDNRYSRGTRGGQRIWIPIWSLGMSWATGRVLNQNPWSAMLESVKASIFGLGRADCSALYPNCDLWKERVKRRRRRRK